METVKKKMIWDVLTEQERCWILEEFTEEIANKDAGDTFGYLKLRYAEHGYNLANVNTLRERLVNR